MTCIQVNSYKQPESMDKGIPDVLDPAVDTLFPLFDT